MYGYLSLIILLLGSSLTVPAGDEPAARHGPAGRIIGHIDRVVVDTGGAHVKGWACQQGRQESITVHIYANGGAYDAHNGTLVLAGKADLDEEPAVDKTCQDTVGRKHRFDIPLPGASLLKFHGMPLYIHGIRVVGNVENAAIAGSGTTRFPDAPPVRQKPSSYPRLSGHYTSLSTHPRVFDTQSELNDILGHSSPRFSRCESAFETAPGKALGTSNSLATV
jgi:hypothetical protein